MGKKPFVPHWSYDCHCFAVNKCRDNDVGWWDMSLLPTLYQLVMETDSWCFWAASLYRELQSWGDDRRCLYSQPMSTCRPSILCDFDQPNSQIVSEYLYLENAVCIYREKMYKKNLSIAYAGTIEWLTYELGNRVGSLLLRINWSSINTPFLLAHTRLKSCPS